MKKKLSKLLCIVVAVVVMVTGCTPASSNPEEAGDIGVTKDAIKVGFSQLGAESDWRVANSDSIRASLTTQNGYQLLFEDARQNQANQAMAIRRFIQQGVDYIVLAPMTEVGWDNVLFEAKEAKIPVILIDRGIEVSDRSLYICHIGSDFRLEADKVTAWIERFRKINKVKAKKINIFDLQGSIGASAQIGRSQGLEAAAEEYGWNIIAQEDGDFTQAKGREVTGRILAEHPEINVIYSENDNMALGAIEACEAAGRKVGSDLKGGDMLVVSFDGINEDALDLLKDGKIGCIGECFPKHGPYVQEAIKKLEAGETPDKELYVNESIYSAYSAITKISARGKDYPVTIMKR